MIGQQGEQYDNERRSLRKYLITIFFLFMLIIFLRKQREEEEEEIKKKAKSNLRKTENYNKSYGFGYIRELSVLKYESVLYISPNRTFLPITHYLDNNTVVHIEGYDNILNPPESLPLEINEEENYVYISAIPSTRNDSSRKKEFFTKNRSSICVSRKESNDVCANINTVIVDQSLFKTVKIASCNSENDGACFFVFVQLDKSMCFNFLNMSYSCHTNNLKNRKSFIVDNFCYVVLASSKIDSLYSFVQTHLLSSINSFNETTNTKEVEIITHFCGNVLNQTGVIDTTNFRLLFMQRYIHFNEKDDTSDNGEEKEDEASKKEDSEDIDKINNAGDLDNFSNVQEESIKSNSDVVDDYDMKEPIYSNIRENFYITVIDLLSENKEIVEYVNYSKLKPQYTLFPPLYIGYDEQINIYFVVNYENNGDLNLVFVSTETFSVYYTLRVQYFYSGWLLKPLSTNESKGLMLLGEYAPYEDKLHVWDVTSFHHSRYYVNTLKTDANI